MKEKISIIDAPCGAGKTTWAIQEMNSTPDRRYIYCTPLLDEIDRIITACPGRRFKQPQNWEQSKLEDFNELLESDEDIAVTHATFLNATERTTQLIAKRNYILILDESLDVIQDFNQTHAVITDEAQRIGKEEVEMLLNSKFIEIKEGGKVAWIGIHCGGKFDAMERYSKAGRLYWINEVLMVCVYPPEVFRAFQKVYVLTYLAEGSPLKSYLDIFSLEYEKVSVTKDVDGKYELCPYTADGDILFRELCRNQIHICTEERLIKPYNSRNSLSKSWYGRNISRASEKTRELKLNTTYFFERVANAKASDLVEVTDRHGEVIWHTQLMWTCYNDFRGIVSGKGYTEGKRYTNAEKEGLSTEQLKNYTEATTPFVPCNTRGSNKYRVRWALAYLINMYYPTVMLDFFASNGIHLNNDAFAVSCLIQWICRSRIRDGLPIELYLPSGRMRLLYQKWLDGTLF